MKVLHVSNLIPSEDFPHRGIFFREQVKGLDRIGLENEIHPIESFRSKLAYFRVGQFNRSLESFDPDLVHVHFSWSAIPVLLSSYDGPLVLSFCGDDLYGHSNSYVTAWIRPYLSRLYNEFLTRRVDRVIVKADPMKDYLLESTSLEASKVSVVPNGVDFEKFNLIPRDRAREKLDLVPDKKYVLNVANPEEPNGVKRVELARKATEKLAEDEENVEFLNPFGISHSEVALYMNAADCYLLTSRSEGSPNVVKESLATGTPVVSTDVGDVAERIEGLSGCRIVEDDVGSIVAGLKDVLFRETVDRETIRSSVERLGLENIGRELEDLYEGLRDGSD